MMTSTEMTLICDCPTKDAIVCRDNPTLRPSYCKVTMRENLVKEAYVTAWGAGPDPSPDSSGARGVTFLAPLAGSPSMGEDGDALNVESAFVQNGALIKPVDVKESEFPTTSQTDTSQK